MSTQTSTGFDVLDDIASRLLRQSLPDPEDVHNQDNTPWRPEYLEWLRAIQADAAFTSGPPASWQEHERWNTRTSAIAAALDPSRNYLLPGQTVEDLEPPLRSWWKRKVETVMMLAVRLVELRRYHSGVPEDAAIATEQLAQVLCHFHSVMVDASFEYGAGEQ